MVTIQKNCQELDFQRATPVHSRHLPPGKDVKTVPITNINILLSCLHKFLRGSIHVGDPIPLNPQYQSPVSSQCISFTGSRENLFWISRKFCLAN